MHCLSVEDGSGVLLVPSVSILTLPCLPTEKNNSEVASIIEKLLDMPHRTHSAPPLQPLTLLREHMNMLDPSKTGDWERVFCLAHLTNRRDLLKISSVHT